MLRLSVENFKHNASIFDYLQKDILVDSASSVNNKNSPEDSASSITDIEVAETGTQPRSVTTS